MLRRAKNKSYKAHLLIASVILVLAIGTGLTISYITTTDDPIENTFVPAVVACSVEETFDGNTKTDVSIKNTGNVNAYIRVAVVITWQADGNTTEILARQPKHGTDYLIEWGDDAWVMGGDGYWYYSEPIAPETNTAILIKKLTQLADAPEGYSLSVEILASAIQSEPADVVEQQWGVANVDGRISPTP